MSSSQGKSRGDCIAATVDPIDGIDGDALYFGTWREPGHFAWLPGMQRHPYDRHLAIRLDSGRWQAPRAREGEAITAANLFRRGWLIREKAGKRWVYKLAQPELRAL